MDRAMGIPQGTLAALGSPACGGAGEEGKDASSPHRSGLSPKSGEYFPPHPPGSTGGGGSTM